MNVPLYENSLLLAIGVAILICIAVGLFLKFLLSREGRKLTERRYMGNSNRAQRRKEKAMSKRKRP
jgi:hypothetical protein